MISLLYKSGRYWDRTINGTAVCTNGDGVYINDGAAYTNGSAVYSLQTSICSVGCRPFQNHFICLKITKANADKAIDAKMIKLNACGKASACTSTFIP